MQKQAKNEQTKRIKKNCLEKIIFELSFKYAGLTNWLCQNVCPSGQVSQRRVCPCGGGQKVSGYGKDRNETHPRDGEKEVLVTAKGCAPFICGHH